MAGSKRARLTHFDARGAARMVDVGEKPETLRVAVASGTVLMAKKTLALVAAGKMGKGDVLGVARLAAIAGLKRTAELIPLCHPVRVVGSDVTLAVDEARGEVRRGAPGVRHDDADRLRRPGLLGGRRGAQGEERQDGKRAHAAAGYCAAIQP